MSVPAPDASTPATPAAAVRFGPYLLDPAQARLVRGDGEVAGLNGKPFELLCVLVAQAGRLLTKDELLDAVWGHRHVSESALKGAINTVRLALGDDARAPLYVETVPRRGYRFVAVVAAVAPQGSAAPVPAPDGEADEPGNLARLPERPVGREAELAQLAAAMDRHRLVTLTGLAGVGKTCLALAMAARVAEPAGGRWLLRLDDMADPALLLPTLTRVLGLGRDAARSARDLALALSERQMLLVLDNAEHLVDAVAEVCAAVLAQAPEVQLLVTSQVPLRLAAEAVLAVPPLAVPPVAAAAGAPDSAAFAAPRLLGLRIAQHLPHWQPTAADHDDIAAICRELDGVPLALELAAARVPLLGLAGVRARLHQRFALLTQGRRDAASRHRTLAAALDWALGLLAAPERQALRQLAVFAGSFELDDAEGVLDQGALDAVEELRARSLLVVQPSPTGLRLRLFDSVRRFVLADLADPAAAAVLRLRHLQWTSHRLQGLWPLDLFEPFEHWLPRWQYQLDNVHEALRFGLAADAPPAALAPAVRLAASATRLWHRAGLFTEGAAWLQQAQQAVARGTVDDDTRAWLYLGVAAFCGHTQQGDPRAALQQLQQARGLAAAPDRVRDHLAAVAEVGLLLRVDPGNTERLQAALRRLHDSQDPQWPEMAQRLSLQLQAVLLRMQGDYAGSLERLDQFGALCLAHGARDSARTAAYLRLQVLGLLGRWDAARSGARALVHEIRSAGRQRDSVFHLATAAAVYLRLGVQADERADLQLALRLLAQARMLWWLADALPWAALHDGRPDDALALQCWADRLVAARGERRGPLFAGIRDQLLAAAAARGGVTGADPAHTPPGEAQALTLALGAEVAAAVLSRPTG